MVRGVDEWFSAEEHYALGTEVGTERHYVSFPVTAGPVGYEEYYLVDDDVYASYLADPTLARPFVEECRRREHDDLLLEKPGWNRGIPY